MIFRRRHTANFTTISNILFDDERLAADEVGVLAYLLSRPHDWEVRRPALMRRWGIGLVAMKRIVHSWMRTGWCHATKVRLRNGQFFIVYDIRDIPGKELSDDEIREALSLVSSEGSADVSDPETSPDHPHVIDEPPPCQPGVDDQLVAAGGWPIRDITNTEVPKPDSTQKIEREHAREKEKHALNLVEFKRRWPTAASDDQATIDAAWFDLSAQDGEDALAGIAPFLENLKRDRRSHVPAGWKYLRQRRWTLLAPAARDPAASAAYPRDSGEARALMVLHEIAAAGDGFRKIYRRPDGSISYRKPVTLRLAALAEAPSTAEWVTLGRNQAAAWEGLLRDTITIQVRKHLKEGDRAPWPWPPSVDGTIYSDQSDIITSEGSAQ